MTVTIIIIIIMLVRTDHDIPHTLSRDKTACFSSAQGSNGIFEYSFQGVVPKLAIDSETGVISLTEGLDYESGDTLLDFTVSMGHVL